MKRKLILLAAIILSFTACAPKEAPNPVKDAILERVKAQTGEGSKLTIEKLQLIDSCTFAGEIRNRINGFEVKRHQDSVYMEKYKSAGQVKKYGEKTYAIIRDNELIGKLNDILTEMGESASDVAYYDYSFSAKGKTADGAQIILDDYYLCITPDGKVLSFVDNKKSLHKGTGKVIPGYAEMFDKESAEE